MTAQFIVGMASVSALVCLSATYPASAQPTFKYSKIEFSFDVPVAYEMAGRSHESDLFVYFYRGGEPRHAKMDSLVFSDERLSGYVNENFGTVAADVETEVGRRLFEIFNPNHDYEGPFVAVLNKHYSKTMFFYGWENGSSWLNDHGLDTNGQHWLTLVSAKEFGSEPARPGEEEWGRWSARVEELMAESTGGK